MTSPSKCVDDRKTWELYCQRGLQDLYQCLHSLSFRVSLLLSTSYHLKYLFGYAEHLFSLIIMLLQVLITFAYAAGSGHALATLGGNTNPNVPQLQVITIPNISSQMCGTEPPSENLRKAHADLRDDKPIEPRQSSQRLLINTYMHFVSTFDQASIYPPNVRNTLMSAQVSWNPR